jgi:carboxyl-terminal processing protease
MRTVLIALGLLLGWSRAEAQLGPLDRARAHDMLRMVRDDLRRHYYDPGYRGIDLEGRFRTADSLLDQAQTIGQLIGAIARMVLELQDSHTIFIPPSQTIKVRYGWDIQMMGDSCYVVGVAPGSDAQQKGLQVGDRVVAIQGVAPTRSLIGLLDYFMYSLNPVNAATLSVVSPAGGAQEIQAASRVAERRQILDLTHGDDIWALIRDADNLGEIERNRFVEVDSTTLAWKLVDFGSQARVDEGINKARRFQNLILDLRGNRGGAERVMLRFLSRLLDHETVVDTLHRRDKVEVLSIKPDEKRFAGKLIVLIDSRSASAAEIVARVVQLEARGMVIGDRSAGAVMRSIYHGHQIGAELAVPYGMNISDAAVIQRDGSQLENVGVVPDIVAIPRGSDLAVERDIAMSEALRQLGYPVPAGGVTVLFPTLALEMENW